jgi:hypothetical protein
MLGYSSARNCWHPTGPNLISWRAPNANAKPTQMYMCLIRCMVCWHLPLHISQLKQERLHSVLRVYLLKQQGSQFWRYIMLLGWTYLSRKRILFAAPTLRLSSLGIWFLSGQFGQIIISFHKFFWNQIDVGDPTKFQQPVLNEVDLDLNCTLKKCASIFSDQLVHPWIWG